ncbi:MAG: hypothetical protein R6U50_06575 [Desulfobacterales bacterium]
MSDKKKETVLIHVNIKVSAQALSTIVDVSKKMAGRDDKGRIQVDTADAVSAIISRFLDERDFEEYVKDVRNYR